MINLSDSTTPLTSESVITLGKFDGLHRGHQELLKRTVAKAAVSGAVAVCFVMDRGGPMLLTKAERIRFLEDYGIKAYCECDLTPDFMSVKPSDFVNDTLIRRFHPVAVVVGDNFTFGRNREGTPTLLKEYGTASGFTTDIVPLVRDDGRKISSTLIRKCLDSGDMGRVSRYLGYDYFVSGEIVHGNRIGRTIHVPTINLMPGPDKYLPPYGVYASVVTIDGHDFRGMTNVGVKPTVSGKTAQAPVVETYLFDVSGDFYGKYARVRLLRFTRPEKNYGSLEALTARLEQDKTDVRQILENLGFRD